MATRDQVAVYVCNRFDRRGWDPWVLGATPVDTILLLATMIITGAIIGVMVILAMGAEDDMQAGHFSEGPAGLRPGQGARVIEPVAGIVYGLITITYAHSIFDTAALSWLQILHTDFYTQNTTGAIINQWLVVSGTASLRDC